MKKILLSLGAIAAVAAPLAAVIACDAGEFGFTNKTTTTLSKDDLKIKVAEAKTNKMTIEKLEAQFGLKGTILPTEAPKDQTITVNGIEFDEVNDILTIKTSSIMTEDGTTSTTEYAFHITAYEATA